MIPNSELVKEWLDLRERGDNSKLAKILGITTQNVSRIVNGGNTTLSNIKKISRFYEVRKVEKQKYAEQDQD